MARGESTTLDQAPTRRGTRSELLSIREAASLLGISPAPIRKAIEQHTISVVRGPRRSASLPVSELAALVAFERLRPLNIPVRMKRQIRDWAAEDTAASELQLTPALVVRHDAHARELLSRARRYVANRARYIESDPEVKGGMPVVTGTRLTTTAVAARVASGESIESIREDYPYIELEALETAAIYGSAHPRRGRPPRPRRGPE